MKNPKRQAAGKKNVERRKINPVKEKTLDMVRTPYFKYGIVSLIAGSVVVGGGFGLHKLYSLQKEKEKTQVMKKLHFVSECDKKEHKLC